MTTDLPTLPTPLPRSRFRFLRSVANRIEKRARVAAAFEQCGQLHSANSRRERNAIDAEDARHWCANEYRAVQP